MPQEDNQLIKKGESVFYGVFLRYLWRNEKTGKCFFQMQTKQKLLLKEQYHDKSVIREKSTKNDITWYTINCDASKLSVPFYEKKTPVRITGYFKSDANNGYCWDFHITSMQEASTEETVAIEYLASDSFPGISYQDAVTIVRYHGPDVFSYIGTKGIAHKIQAETGLSASTVKDMMEIIGNTVEERKLYEFLGPLGIPYPFCVKAVNFYGIYAEKRLRENPHYIGNKLGLTFQQSDTVAAAYGFRSNYRGRLRQAVYESLTSIGNNGNVYDTQENFYKIFYRTLKSESFQQNEYRPSLIDFFTPVKDILGILKIGDEECFYNKDLYKAEERIARNLLRLSAIETKEQLWDDSLINYAQEACGMNYGSQQRAAFPVVLRSRGLKIVIGGPGTGKTTTIKGIILAYQKMFPNHRIRLCAPTGRAAQRMAESTEMEAVTVHRLLDYRPYGDSNTHKDANNPIDADFIVVDEMSMMSIELFDIFLSAIKTGTTVIFVGDTNQLEAVGAGSILHDLLEMPDTITHKCRLTEVFRQKGGSPIIENAIRINRGMDKMEVCEDFQIIRTKCEEESEEAAVKLMKELYNPENPFETQILCPARKGKAGIDNLNTVLQKELNPGKKGMTYGHTVFRKNDKIMMTNNNYDSECNYYNGDIGIIKEITDSVVKVEIRGSVLDIKKSMLEEMKLSYGMTIHKSQGSEFKNVIVIMPMEPRSMLVRNLFYTAITRAKQRVFIINEASAMETSIKTDKSSARKTTLLKQMRYLLGQLDEKKA